MADDPNDGGGQGPAASSLDDRVGQLESGQQSLSGKVDKILGILGGAGGDGDGGHAPQGSGVSVAEEIRAQLEQQRRDDAAAAAERDRDARLSAAETTLRDMTEKQPGPLPRRSTRLMWGKE